MGILFEAAEGVATLAWVAQIIIRARVRAFINKFGWAVAWVAGAVFAELRISGAKGVAFQAFAHLLMGSLITIWYAGSAGSTRAKWTTIVLSLIELACFIAQRIG